MIGPREGVLFGAHLGRAIVTNDDFTASVCDSASTVEAVVWGGGCGGQPIVHVVQGEGEVLGVFVLYFHNGKCHWVADGELFPIRMRKRDISVRQTYHWKARFVGFLAIYSLSRWVYEKLAKSNACSTTT